MKTVTLVLALTVFFFNASNAEITFPIGGSLSNKNSSSPKFLNFRCEYPGGKEQLVKCSKTITTIKPKREKLMSKDELVSIAKQDNFSASSVKDFCLELEPLFSAYYDGKPIKGMVLTEEKKNQVKSLYLAMGYDKDVISMFRDLCANPSDSGIVEMMHQMQVAESKVCELDSFTHKATDYKFDKTSGKWMWSEVINGFCDQYVYTEVLTLDEFGLGNITNYVEKRTFIQQLRKGAERELGCSKPVDYEDDVWVQKEVYFPIQCISIVRD